MNARRLFALAIANLWLGNASSLAKEPILTEIGPSDELNVVETIDKLNTHLRVSNSYVCVELKDYGVIVIAKAPDWTVRSMSTKKKLYCDTPLPEWLRRGVPMNFLRLSTLPDWPTVKTVQKTYMNARTTVFALPYRDRAGHPVPLNNGSVGEMLVFQGVGSPVGQLLATIGHIPKVTGVTLRMHLSDTDGADRKYSSLFVFTGGNSMVSHDLVTKKLWVTKTSALPSVQGMRLCHDSRDVWVSSADAEGINELMR